MHSVVRLSAYTYLALPLLPPWVFWIVPGATWVDTAGAVFNAHAGGLTVDHETGRFYWFGEYKTEGQHEGGGVSEFHGLALEPQEGHEWIANTGVIQRPKVVFSKQTGKYHMFWHADDRPYTRLAQVFATADRIAGPYTFQKAFQPLGTPSQDFGIFTDYKDEKSYALYSSGDSVEGRDVFISAFNDDLTDVKEVTYCFQKYDFEAPTILQTDRSYFAIMSHKTGYRPNNVVAMRADSLKGPWSQPFFIGPPYTRTFSTQSGFSCRIPGSEKTAYLYMGDLWDKNAIWESRNVWLPLEIDEDKRDMKLVWHDVFDLDTKTGNWAPVEGTTYYSKDGELRGKAFLQEANFASHCVIATGIYGDEDGITFTVEGQGGDQWVSFHHQNIDDMGYGDQPYGQPDRIGSTWQLRHISSIIVNGDDKKVYKIAQKDTHKGTLLAATIKLSLKKGKNTLRIGGLSNGFDCKGADLDRVIVYPCSRVHQGRAEG
ncbi:glycosyl hydrolase [Plectosphaerella cucumerina]|uniref:Glycosyl hydrolase n=1 Tax=Plectosphaerella cucumerina TaxID=40658 RepID=A0A8K0TSH0_9PEZI|nr:glycosyl hydrolase [Plectosphaerella cucumerina]